MKNDNKPHKDLKNIQREPDASGQQEEHKLIKVKKKEEETAEFQIHQKPSDEQQLEEED